MRASARDLSPPNAHERELLAELDANGFLVLRGIVKSDIVAKLHDDLRERFERTPFCRGDFYGSRTKRFGGLLKRSPHAAALAMHPLIMRLSQFVLEPNCDRLQLSLTQALQIHPGECVQAPHRDQDMYWAPPGKMEYLLNVMWPFSPYTTENGATLLYPGSNKKQPDAPYDTQAAYSAEMAPGDALFFLGSTLHCAGANRSPAPRTGMIVGYSLGWLKPYENQWLAYPPEVARAFPAELAALIGYCQQRPNLGNYEGQCPSVLLRSNAPEYLEAVDEVTPEQEAALAWFKSKQGLSNAA